MNTNQSLVEKDQKLYLPVFKRYPFALERGEGCRVWDIEGNEYLDAMSGIAVTNLGHCHPKVVEAIKDQVERLIHISNFYISRQQVELSEILSQASGLNRVFLTNSGTESIEGAIKIARKYAHSKGRGGEILSMTGSFHGQSLAAVATGDKDMHEGFEPTPAGFAQVAFNDLEAVKSAVTDKTAAIIVEPVQGEGGINPADEAFLDGLRKLCSLNDIVLIFDEVQCGIGRTGKIFAKEHYGIQPDILTLAKGLGNGIPIGAFLCKEQISQVMSVGDHGSTFGGNPLACAAAIATLKVLTKDSYMREVQSRGQYLVERIKARKSPYIKDIRGIGLMLGLEFNFETQPLVEQMLTHNVLATSAAEKVLRLVPPLIITESQMDHLVDVIFTSLDEIEKDVKP